MRIPCMLIGTVLACGLAFAAQNEAVVYTAGNLTGITPRANAVLDLSQDVAMKLRIGRTDVSVPFAAIIKTDEAADSTVVPAPGQKNVKPFELLTVQFNSVQGEQRSMTLQMSKLSASHVLTTIHKHVPAETVVSAVQSTPPGTAASSPSTATASTADNSASEKKVKPAKAPKADQQAKTDAAKTDKQAKADKAAADKQAKADKAAADKQAKADKAKADQEAKVAKKDKKDKKDAKTEDTEVAAKKDAWWGDTYWKTNRNLPTWQQQGSVAAAQ